MEQRKQQSKDEAELKLQGPRPLTEEELGKVGGGDRADVNELGGEQP